MFCVATEKSRVTRLRARLLRSSASIVFWKVAGSPFDAMAAISSRSSARAAVKALGNRSGRIWSHGGTPPYGPVHGATSALTAGALDLLSFAISPHATAATPTTPTTSGPYFLTDI